MPSFFKGCLALLSLRDISPHLAELSQLDRSCLWLEIFLFHVKQFCFGQKFEWNRFPSFCRKNRRIAKICSSYNAFFGKT